jgi:nucleotide-binding universal stress UspA family protein
MFKKILYPTDFSDVANSAIAFVKRFKDAGTEEVVILHVLDKSRYDAAAMFRGSDKDMLSIEKHWETDALNRLKPIEEELKKAGLKVKVRIVQDYPFRGILKVEEEEAVSAIIIGSHGITNIQEMLLGSVAEKVIRKARKPVLVVKR